MIEPSASKARQRHPYLSLRTTIVSIVVCILLALAARLASAGPIDPAAYAKPIRVACVGASITKGVGAHPGMGYSDQVQRLLGSKWLVSNFGVSGATIMKVGKLPYGDQPACAAAHVFQPDVVVILLGTNDTKPQNWAHRDEFVPDCEALVESFKNLPSHARVFLCRLPPVIEPGNYGISPTHLKDELRLIDQVGKAEDIDIVDVNTPLLGKPGLFPDRVHPNDTGAAIIARTVAEALTGKKS